MTGDRAGSLESELALLSEQAGSSPERRQQLIAFRFYLLEAMILSTAREWLNNAFGFSHYLTLLNYLYDWHRQTSSPIRVATFNYDTLIDAAALDVFTGLTLNALPITSRGATSLIQTARLDGMVAADPESPKREFALLRTAMELAVSEPLPGGEIIARYPPPPGEGANDIVLPALAVPMAGKTAFECPIEHLETLRIDLPNVRTP